MLSYMASATLLYNRMKELDPKSERYKVLWTMYVEARKVASQLEEEYGSMGDTEKVKAKVFTLNFREAEVEVSPRPKDAPRYNGLPGEGTCEEGPGQSHRDASPETERLLDALLWPGFEDGGHCPDEGCG